MDIKYFLDKDKNYAKFLLKEKAKEQDFKYLKEEVRRNIYKASRIQSEEIEIEEIELKNIFFID